MTGVQDPNSAQSLVLEILSCLYSKSDWPELEQSFRDVAAIYRGEFPGYRSCETPYHNLQHILDVTIAAARLVDGYEKSHPDDRLGENRAILTIVVSLFHDVGYIRRSRDTAHTHGAEYTKTHVSRGAKFLTDYLPKLGMESQVPLAAKTIHYTGYEVPLSSVLMGDPKDNLVGYILGTADLIAQMADRVYLEKCRDHLFEEFKIAGMLRRKKEDGTEEVLAETPEDLLRNTPMFMKNTIEQRLEKAFEKTYEYAAVHFGGENLYMKEIQSSFEYLERVIKSDTVHLLRREADQGDEA